MDNPEGKAQRPIMQLKHNVGARIQIHNPRCYCSAAAQLWSNLNSDSVLGGNLKLPVCLVVLQRVTPQSQQSQVLPSPMARHSQPKFVLVDNPTPTGLKRVDASP